MLKVALFFSVDIEKTVNIWFVAQFLVQSDCVIVSLYTSEQIVRSSAYTAIFTLLESRQFLGHCS